MRDWNIDTDGFLESDFEDVIALTLALRATGGTPATWEPAFRPKLAVGEIDCGDCGEEVFPRAGITPMLSRMDLTSAGIAMWCTMLTAGQSAAWMSRFSPETGALQHPGQPRPANRGGGEVLAH